MKFIVPPLPELAAIRHGNDELHVLAAAALGEFDRRAGTTFRGRYIDRLTSA